MRAQDTSRNRPPWPALAAGAALVLAAAVFWFAARQATVAVQLEREHGPEHRPAAVAAEEQAERSRLEGSPGTTRPHDPDATRGDARTPVAGAGRDVLGVRVVSSVHGRPLTGVDVLLLDGTSVAPGEPRRATERATSDFEGALRFEVPAGVPWELEVEPARGHGYVYLEVAALRRSEARTVELQLPTTGDLPWYGRVTVDGRAQAGARARLLDFSDGGAPRLLDEAESDPTGLVRFEGSSWRALDVRVEAPGIGLTVCELLPGHERPATAQELALWPVASLRCTVSGPGGAPLAGVEARAFARSWELLPPGSADAYTAGFEVLGVTDGQGVALLEDIPAETALDFLIRRGDDVLWERARAFVLPARQRTERRFVVGQGEITGRVETSDGAPLVGAPVDLHQVKYAAYSAHIYTATYASLVVRSSMTDAAGRFAFERVPFGSWYVGTLHEEGRHEEGRHEEGSGAGSLALAPRVELSAERPRADVTLRFEPGLTIQGVVVDEAGVGLADVRLSCWNDSHGGPKRPRTDGEGRFSLGPLPPGLFEVVPHKTDGYVGARTVQAAAGTRDLRFVLRRGSTLRGRVVDAVSGALVPESLVFAFAPHSDNPYASHDIAQAPDGTFELSGLPEGEIALRATTDDGGLGLLTGIRLRSGEDAGEVEVRLQPGIQVRARYVGQAGDDLAVQALQEGVVISYVATEPGESITFHVQPGPLLVRALGAGLETCEQELTVSPGDHPDVVLGRRD